MDSSSRNIVTFIATITVAALILMGAHFFAQSSDGQNIAQNAAATETPDTGPAAAEPDAANDEIQDSGFDVSNEEVVVEDPERITGEPSLNIETNTDAVQTEG